MILDIEARSRFKEILTQLRDLKRSLDDISGSDDAMNALKHLRREVVKGFVNIEINDIMKEE